ncbi:MAG: tetratricopeptide repeat protein [Nitrospinota bacterium]
MSLYNQIKKKKSSYGVIPEVEISDVQNKVVEYLPKILISVVVLSLLAAAIGGYSYYRSASFKKANINLYNAVISIPNDIESESDIKLHVESLNRVINESSNNQIKAEALFELATIYHAQSRYDDATRAYKKSIDLVNGSALHSLALFRLANIYMSSGEFDDAIDSYRQLESFHTFIPSDLVSYYKSIALASMQDQSEGIPFASIKDGQINEYISIDKDSLAKIVTSSEFNKMLKNSMNLQPAQTEEQVE